MNVVFTDSIRQFRIRRGLNRRDLSIKSGLHKDAIQRIEAGEYKPTKNTCQRIADALEVDLSEIYGTDGTMDKVNLLRAALIEVEERLDVICKVVDATNSFLERIDSEDAEIDEQAHKCLTQVLQLLKR